MLQWVHYTKSYSWLKLIRSVRSRAQLLHHLLPCYFLTWVQTFNFRDEKKVWRFPSRHRSCQNRWIKSKINLREKKRQIINHVWVVALYYFDILQHIFLLRLLQNPFVLRTLWGGGDENEAIKQPIVHVGVRFIIT